MTLEAVFLQVLNMSFTAGVTALVVMAARLLLRRAPRAALFALWGVVLFRLVCPFTLESAMSLLPANPQPIKSEIVYAARPQVHTELPLVDNAVSAGLPVPRPEASVNPLQIWTAAGALIWVLGMAGMAAHSALSLARLKRRLRGAQGGQDRVWSVPGLETAFVLGAVRPRIYLPAELNEREKEYILLHERTHIRRGDHLFKLAGYLALCVHWFNPLVWAAFLLSGRDMEMACDEAVIRQLGNEVKKAYSVSLLNLAAGRRIMAGTPLAFGEGDTKGRIRNVLRFRKPAVWVSAAAIAVVAALCLGLALNRPERTAQVRVGGQVYRQQGTSVAHLPAGSTALGALQGVVPAGNGAPERDMQAVNLEERYVGCTIYENGVDHLYLEMEDGAYLPFARTEDGAGGFSMTDAELAQMLNLDGVRVFCVSERAGGRYFVGFFAGGDGASELGACAIAWENGRMVLQDRVLCPGVGREGQCVAVGSLNAFGARYDVVLSNRADLYRIQRVADGEKVTVDTGGAAPDLAVLDVPENGYKEARFTFYDAQGGRLDEAFTTRQAVGANARILEVDGENNALNVQLLDRDEQGRTARVALDNAQILWMNGDTAYTMGIGALSAGQEIAMDYGAEEASTNTIVASRVQILSGGEFAVVESVARLQYGRVTQEEIHLSPARQEYALGLVLRAQASSAAWEGMDIAGLEECFRIVVRYAGEEEAQQHYAYFLPEGIAVLQHGVYTILPEEDWAMLCSWMDSWKGLEERPGVLSTVRLSSGTQVATLSPLQGEARELVREIIASSELKAAREAGVDVNALAECYALQEKRLDGDSRVCYAYREGGQAKLQWGEDGRRTALSEGEYARIAALFAPEESIELDMDGDGKAERAYWRENKPGSYGYGLSLMVESDGAVRVFAVEAQFPYLLAAADVTGDGRQELIYMADTGGVGGAGCYEAGVLRLQDGALVPLPLPRTQEDGDAWSTGYRFQVRYVDGFARRVTGDKLDVTVPLREEEKSWAVEYGVFDRNGRAKSDMPSAQDGICHMEIVPQGGGASALRIYQYLWMDGHSDGQGYGASLIRWNGEAFELVEQSWAEEWPEA